VAKTYQAVINGLHLNLDEPVAAPSVREEISDEKDNKLNQRLAGILWIRTLES